MDRNDHSKTALSEARAVQCGHSGSAIEPHTTRRFTEAMIANASKTPIRALSANSSMMSPISSCGLVTSRIKCSQPSLCETHASRCDFH